MNEKEMAELLINRFTFAERIYYSDIAKRKIARACAESLCIFMAEQSDAKKQRFGGVGYWQKVKQEIEDLKR
jgi:hypothetical protein